MSNLGNIKLTTTEKENNLKYQQFTEKQIKENGWLEDAKDINHVKRLFSRFNYYWEGNYDIKDFMQTESGFTFDVYPTEKRQTITGTLLSWMKDEFGARIVTIHANSKNQLVALFSVDQQS